MRGLIIDNLDDNTDDLDGNTDDDKNCGAHSVPLIQQSLAVLRLNRNIMDSLLKYSAFGRCQVERYQCFMKQLF